MFYNANLFQMKKFLWALITKNNALLTTAEFSGETLNQLVGAL